MKCTIKRIDGSVAYKCDISDDTLSVNERLTLAVKEALARRVDLSYAKLTSMCLAEIEFSDHLVGIDFTGSDLFGATFSGSNLTGANFSHCCLAECDLREANLTDANFHNASMSKSKIAGANFTNASLDHASFVRVDLGDVNFEDANIEGIKRDFFNVLSNARDEVNGLRAALTEGRINGSAYIGKCACLIGTIAKIRKVKYSKLGTELTPDSSRLAERWFVAIGQGDTPANNEVSSITVKWIDEFLAS